MGTDIKENTKEIYEKLFKDLFYNAVIDSNLILNHLSSNLGESELREIEEETDQIYQVIFG